ncbi:MAG: serine/threonine protein kinase [Planctomycetaceae bacterium]|nr:serine/threonine protein kinase [Planctomycetaceae bacterium]
MAGFADVLTSPVFKLSGNSTDSNGFLCDPFVRSLPGNKQTCDFGWELNSVSHRGTFFTVGQARPMGRNGAFLYAVKQLNHQWRRSPVGRAVICRETELGRLISHPHLVPTLDGVTDSDDPYLVQPWLQGKTLQEFLSRGRNAKPVEMLWIARQIAEALVALEKQGYCHSDVKPGNIIVSPNGHATLIDLGLARQTGEPSLSIDSAVVGTPKYMAPELTDTFHPIDIRADLYSLGLVMLEMLFGETIFSMVGASRQVHVEQWHAHWESLADRTDRRRSWLADLESLLCAMTDFNAAKRPESADLLVRRLISLELAAI